MNIEDFKFTEDQKKFVTEEIDRLKKLENKSQTEEIILTLVSNIESGTPTKQQISSFERIMKNEFKKYKARLELEKIKEDEKKLLAGLKKEAQVAQAKDRKKRDGLLIPLWILIVYQVSSFNMICSFLIIYGTFQEYGKGMFAIKKFTINNSTKAMLVGLIPLGMLYGLVLFVKIRLGILF